MLTASDDFLVSNIVGVSQCKPSVDIEMSDEQFRKLLVKIDAWVHNLFRLFLDECRQSTPDCPAGVKVTIKKSISGLAFNKGGRPAEIIPSNIIPFTAICKEGFYDL